MHSVNLVRKQQKKNNLSLSLSHTIYIHLPYNKNIRRRGERERMGEQEEGGEMTMKKKRVAVVESLGWLTESTIMPKKHRAIAGVGPSSIFELKAELYKSQEDSKRSKDQQQLPTTDHHLDYHRAKKKITSRDPLSLKNSGVDARSLKDKLELKAVNDGSASYAALERKAELYEKLAKGELSDEDDKEKYCVDFFSKSLSKDESQQPQDCNPFSTESLVEDEGGENDASVSADSNPLGLGRTAATLDNNEHKRFVREVHEEASEARKKVYEHKLRRQEQAAARREKLKQAYLRKQLEKLKAASKTQQT